MRREEESNTCLVCGRVLDHGSSQCVNCQAARNAPIQTFAESMRANVLLYIALAAHKTGRSDDWPWIQARFRGERLAQKIDEVERVEFANALLFECGVYSQVADIRIRSSSDDNNSGAT